jgi:hypothetical protein
MKHFLLTVMIIFAASSAQAADVGVTVSVGQPGFYGRIDIGNAPQPQLVYANPVVIHPAPAGVVYQPIYVHVPPGHEKHWSKHCAKYNACGRPVYFVRDKWYNNVYVPHYQAHHGNNHGENHGKKHDGDRHGDNHGHGKGHD